MKRVLDLSALALIIVAACGGDDTLWGVGANSGGSSASSTTDATMTSTSGQGGGNTTSNSGGSGTGGSGATGSYCGDGVIDMGEECDDADEVPDDGCTQCIVDCPGGPQSIKHPQTFHCYRFFENQMAWTSARDACVALGEGWALVALSTIEERDAVADVVTAASQNWVGGNDREEEGKFVWSNGEPWTYGSGPPFWQFGQPDSANNSDCVSVSGDGQGDDSSCSSQRSYSCEHTPLGKLP